MDKILSINTIKNVFSALGAKTSDDNYGVALLDKTSGEPKGLMGMSDLASVLGERMNIYIPNGVGEIKIETGSALTSRPMGLSVYQANSSTSDLPIASSGQGRLVYIFTEASYGVVFFMKRNTSTIYFNNFENNTWTGWYMISGTAV